MILLLEKILPLVAIVIGLVLVTIYRKIDHPSPLVWDLILRDLGSVRFQEVIDYNEQFENEEPISGRLGLEARRRKFAVNWGYLRGEVTNTVLFQRALLFEKNTIDAKKSGSEYKLTELAALELLDGATQLRWEQVRCQMILQLRAKLGLKVDEESFVNLLLRYKLLERHMIELAETKGKWLHDMMLERLGLTEWRVIEGGESDYEPA